MSRGRDTTDEIAGRYFYGREAAAQTMRQTYRSPHIHRNGPLLTAGLHYDVYFAAILVERDSYEVYATGSRPLPIPFQG